MSDIFPINLQLFAEGEVAGETGADSANTGEDTQASERMFTQADVDRMINQRLARQQRDTDKRVEQARQEGKTEAERLAAMSAEEREKAQREKAESDFKAREDALKQREAEVQRKELRAQALETLAEKGLPATLADILTYTDADSCKASIATVEKTWREAVKKGVDDALAKSSAPLTRSSGTAEKPKDKGVELAEKLGSRAKAANQTYQSIIDKYK